MSVYGEAKGEYTRQLCTSLVPTLESYFLDMLETAKGEAPHPSKVLWQFQTMLQAIPDWNQDKVIRETEKIQSDCKCDYLEELLTAVFIAHTKVLSAIRLTTKQKKLQITIPKLDHFLHRVLSDCARQLWTNVFLFADTTSIEKQKNLRQVADLLKDSVLQAIRGMLPVKNILREYLHDDDDDDEQKVAPVVPQEEKVAEAEHAAEAASVKGEGEEEEEEKVAEAASSVLEGSAASPAPAQEEEAAAPVVEEEEAAAAAPSLQQQEQVAVQDAPPIAQNTEEEAKPPAGPPVIHIDAKPAVSFQQGHTFFSSDDLAANEIQDVPFAEAELREDEEEDDEENFEEIDSVQITDEFVSLEAEELP